MINHNLTKAAKVVLLTVDGTNYTKVAGTGDTNNSGSVDMLGFNAVCFAIALGALTATQATTFQAQVSSDNSTWTNIGSTISPLDADSNKTLVIDIYRPGKRYVRVVTVRATANAALNSLMAIQYHVENAPVTADASNSQTSVLSTP